jgi:hypothetical protein
VWVGGGYEIRVFIYLGVERSILNSEVRLIEMCGCGFILEEVEPEGENYLFFHLQEA